MKIFCLLSNKSHNNILGRISLCSRNKVKTSEEKEKSEIHRTKNKLTQRANAFKETLFNFKITFKFKDTTRNMLKFIMVCAMK